MGPVTAVGSGCLLIVAAVLTAAAVGKAFDRDGTTAIAGALGVPARAAVLVGWVLPAGEAAVAVGLVAVPRVAAVAAAGLFAMFTVTVIVARGATSCGCFGVFGGARPGLPAVARNLALLAAAGLATESTADFSPITSAVVAATMIGCVPLARSRRRGVVPTSVTHVLVVDDECPECERLLLHLAGTLTGTEPMALITRGGQGRRPVHVSMATLSDGVLSGTDVPACPALLIVDPESAILRPLASGIAQVFTALTNAGLLSTSPTWTSVKTATRRTTCTPCGATATETHPTEASHG
jgi:hypothetical protein